ncbi:MAG: peptidoglycan-associated lipoprotein [Proteobacteria bacterium]|nr:MAG: peptidoglycan-associated lipoprotein [Pseudomonadota bacterium]
MIFKKKTLALVLSMAVMAGCSSTDTRPVVEDGNEIKPVDTSGGQTTTVQDSDVTEQQLSYAEREEMAKEREAAALREIRTFYFSFDGSELKPESRLPLMAHARFLVANPGANIVIEGYCDERGTKEYNMALGERRAKSIERFLVINGVSRRQIETISYGEENPAAFGHDEESWAQNRRAVISYQ